MFTYFYNTIRPMRICLLICCALGMISLTCIQTAQAGEVSLGAGLQAAGLSARSGTSPQLVYTAHVAWEFDNHISLRLHTSHGHRPWNEVTGYFGNVTAGIGYTIWKHLTVYGGLGPVWQTVVLQPYYRYTNYGAALNIGVMWPLQLYGPLYALPQVDITGILAGGELYFQYGGGIGLALVF